MIVGKSRRTPANASELMLRNFYPSDAYRFTTAFGEGLFGATADLYRFGEFVLAEGTPLTEDQWRNSAYYREGLEYKPYLNETRAKLIAERWDHNFGMSLLQGQPYRGVRLSTLSGALLSGITDPLNFAGIPMLGSFSKAVKTGEKLARRVSMVGGGAFAQNAARAIGRTASVAKTGAISGVIGGVASESVSLVSRSGIQDKTDIGMSLFNIAAAGAAGGAFAGTFDTMGRAFGINKKYLLFDNLRKNAPDLGTKGEALMMSKAIYDVISGKPVSATEILPEFPESFRVKESLISSFSKEATFTPEVKKFLTDIAEIFPEIKSLQILKESAGPVRLFDFYKQLSQEMQSGFTPDHARVLDLIGASGQDFLAILLSGNSTRSLSRSQIKFLEAYHGKSEVDIGEAYADALSDSIPKYQSQLDGFDKLRKGLISQYKLFTTPAPSPESPFKTPQNIKTATRDNPSFESFTEGAPAAETPPAGSAEAGKASSQTGKAKSAIDKEIDDINAEFAGDTSAMNFVKQGLDTLKKALDEERASLGELNNALKDAVNCMKSNL